MSYNPSTGVYSLPAIYLAIPGTVIIAAQHNTPLEDLATANNYARPVIAGGTGSNTTIGAANTLKVVSYGGSQSLTDAEKQQARDNFTSALVDVASAATTPIAAANSQYVRVTGTTPITGFDAADSGTEVSILFAASLVLNHNGTSFILPGAANITTAAGDLATVVCEGGANWRFTSYTFASSMPAAYAGVPDFVQGLTLSNNSGDPNNDIDIAAGTAKAGQKVVVNAGTFTKRLDASWAAGSGNGGLDTGSKAVSTTYHVHSIINDTTAAFDALFSLSATSPTVPSGWTRVQRIGAVITDASGNIRAFVQRGKKFLLSTPVLDINTASLGTTATLFTLTVPSGVEVEAMMNVRAGTLNREIYISSPSVVDLPPSGSVAPLSSIRTGSGDAVGIGPLTYNTDSSRQIRAVSNAASTALTAATIGWVDYQLQRI